VIQCDYGGSKKGFVKIPSNLYSALKRLRFERVFKRRIWADAVCINQEDMAERSQQVCMMRDIFANASQVPIWLGDHTERWRKMCELIDELSQGLPHLRRRIPVGVDLLVVMRQ
jgi:hypothetical protein